MRCTDPMEMPLTPLQLWVYVHPRRSSATNILSEPQIPDVVDF